MVADDNGALFDFAPSSELDVGHGNADQDGSDDEDTDEDLFGGVDSACNAVKEVRDAVVGRAEVELLLLGNRKQGSVECEGTQGFIDKLLDFFEGEADGVRGEVLNLSKSWDGVVEFIEVLI